MNYYVPNVKQELFLYNKALEGTAKIFPDIESFKKWLYNSLHLVGNKFCGTATDLTMDMSDPLPIYNNKIVFSDGHVSYYETDEILGYRKHLVIITNYKAADDYSIFNYVPYMDELKKKLLSGENTHSYGSLHRYSQWCGEDEKNLPEFRKGSVPHVHKVKHNSRTHLIINKAERAAITDDNSDIFHYDADTDSFIEYDIPHIKTRPTRKILASTDWDYAYTDHNYRYGKPSSWKNIKKEAQWM